VAAQSRDPVLGPFKVDESEPDREREPVEHDVFGRKLRRRALGRERVVQGADSQDHHRYLGCRADEEPPQRRSEVLDRLDDPHVPGDHEDCPCSLSS
jgi:hypothetical protein